LLTSASANLADYTILG